MVTVNQSGHSEGLRKKPTSEKGHSKRQNSTRTSDVSRLTNPCIRRLARRAGVKRVSSLIYDEVRRLCADRLKGYLRTIEACCEHRKARTVSVQDVIYALARNGQRVYGY